MANDQAISKKTKKGIDALKKPFMAFSTAFGALAISRAELAPKFMKVYGAYLQETGGSYVDFVRMVDPSVPADRAAYREHKSYKAAEYLRRLVARRDVKGNRQKPVRSNLAAMARLIATIQPLVADVEAFWKGLSAEFGLTARQTGRLRQVVGASQPLLKINVARPSPVRVIHVTPEQMTEAAQSSRRAAA
jgi:hypothetical protein